MFGFLYCGGSVSACSSVIVMLVSIPLGDSINVSVYGFKVIVISRVLCSWVVFVSCRRSLIVP